MIEAPVVAEQPIGDVRWRDHVRVTGQVRSIRVRPWADTPTMECRLADDTGGITVVFLGRRRVAGVRLGTVMTVTGTAGEHDRHLAILNPAYELHPT